eukprot:jgi/Chrzof1/15019/Cz09g24060.t1
MTLACTTQPCTAQQSRLVYYAYCLLGAGVLAPWNAFITAADYFEAVFPGRHMDRLFTVCYMPVCLALVGAQIKWRGIVSHRVRILTSFAGFSTVMLLVPVVDLALVAGNGQESRSALVIILMSVVLVGVLDGLCQGAIFGDAAQLPGDLAHAVVGGTASSGVIISLLRIITKASVASTPSGLRQSTAIFFVLAAALSLLCFIVYAVVVPRLAFVKQWRRQQHLQDDMAAVELSPCSQSSSQSQHGPMLLTAGTARSYSTHEHGTVASDHHNSRKLLAIDQQLTEDGCDEQPLIGSHENSSSPDQLLSPPQHCQLEVACSWQECAAKVWKLGAAICVLYVVTLSIFPGFLAEDARSAELGDWYPIILITLFNVADLISKNIPFFGLQPSHNAILVCALSRIGFVGVFIAATKFNASSVIIGLLTTLLGLSNGFLTALIMTLAPMGLPPHAADMVENIIVFCLVAGLTIGAFCGWLWLLY